MPLALKDAFNGLRPDQDAGVQAVVDKVNDPTLPKVVEAVYGIPAPAAPRTDLFEIFLTGIAADNGFGGPVTGRPELAVGERRHQPGQLPPLGDAPPQHEHAGGGQPEPPGRARW